MKQRMSCSLVLLASLALPALAAEPAETLDAYVRQVVEDWEVPGLAIAVVKDGELVFAEGYGTTEIGGSEAVDEHTLFAIGSTTKAMTAALLGTLVDQELMGWDDAAVDHLPGLRLHDPWVTRELTVRDLLTHRAGLGNADLLWYGADRSRAEILRKLARVEPAYSMRDGFIYQNIMYIAAGELAAAVAGSSWEEMLVERLLDPLEMRRTRPTLGGAAPMPNVAAPHDRVDGRVSRIENASVDSAGPAGSVWSSVDDMSRWLRMLLAGGERNGRRLLSADVVRAVLEPQTLLDLSAFYPVVELIEPHWTTYGLGWFQLDYQGRAVSFHTGSIDGMAAIAGLIPEERLGVVVLENLDHAECRHALLWKVFDLWGDGAAERDWSAELRQLYAERAREAEATEAAQREARVGDTSPSVPLERYAGTYGHPVYDEIGVIFDDGRLFLEVGPGLRGWLSHWHYDTFELSFERPHQGTTPATFSLGSDGSPVRLEVMGLTWDRTSDD